jgi:hypothetical protein
MIPDAGHEVRGTWVTGLTRDNMRTLDYFEGDDYERRKVKIRLLAQVGNDKGEGNVEGEERVAETYIYRDEAMLEQQEWDFEEFRRDKLRKWTRAGHVFEGKYPVRRGRPMGSRETDINGCRLRPREAGRRTAG